MKETAPSAISSNTVTPIKGPLPCTARPHTENMMAMAIDPKLIPIAIRLSATGREGPSESDIFLIVSSHYNTPFATCNILQ